MASTLEDKLASALRDKDKVEAIRSGLRRLRKHRVEALSKLSDYEALRQAASEIKNRAVRSLPQLVERFASQVKKQGGTVHMAVDAEQARKTVLDVLSLHGVTRVVKSKSMTSEEIGLNGFLEKAGIEVVDTDLGERAVQLSGEKPSHIVAPAMHLTRHDFARLLKEKEGVEVSADPEQITRAAREVLRKRFMAAQAAVSGANFLVAETGSVVLVTNEGNGRLGPSIPPVYIVVAGIEKLVESLSDAATLLELLPRSATGQNLTVYTTFTNGPQIMQDGSLQDFHVVLIDNGRLKSVGTELEPSLKCIRCGACLNTCPTFNVVGGHVFGDVYSGPMGVLWTAVTKGYGAANEFSDMCISCGLCSSVCPTRIPIAETIIKIKSTGSNRRGRRRSEKVLTSVGTIEKYASTAPWLWNGLVSSPLGRFAMSLLGLDARRSAPLVSGKLRIKSELGEPCNTFIYFSDVFARYNESEIGLEAKRVFDEAGLILYYPEEQTEAGMPYLSYGMVQKARRVASKNIEALVPYVQKGYRVVTTEPTALYMLREIYPMLIEYQSARLLAKNSFSAAQTLLQYVEKGEIRLAKKFGASKVFYHSPCHARALGGSPYPELLRAAGYEVVTSDVTCCGIAGSFGYKKGVLGYELSVTVGEELFEQARGFDGDLYSTDSSVCGIQLFDLLKKRSAHPLKLIRVETTRS